MIAIIINKEIVNHVIPGVAIIPKLIFISWCNFIEIDFNKNETRLYETQNDVGTRTNNRTAIQFNDKEKELTGSKIPNKLSIKT